MNYLNEPEDRDIPTMDDYYDGCDAAWAASVEDRCRLADIQHNLTPDSEAV